MSDLNAAFTRMFPSDNLEGFKVGKETIVAVGMLREEMRQSTRATLTDGDLDRMSRHNPKDPE